MIASMSDGRIRMRDSKLKEGAFAGELKRRLSKLRGLKEILINIRVGSTLIVYDTALTSAEKITSLIGRYLEVPQETEISNAKRVGINTRRTIGIGLLASLATSLVALVFGSKALHAAFGLVFLCFAAVHNFSNIEKLLLA